MKLLSRKSRAAGLIVGAVLLLLGVWASLVFGATNFDGMTAFRAIFAYDDGIRDQVVIRTTRWPRALIAVAVGAALAVAGAVMQAITRNPLASPGVLGVNAGATFFIITAALVFSISHKLALMGVAFLGASVSAGIVYALGSLGRDGLSPLRIVMAGAALTAMFASFTQMMLVTNKQGLNSVLFWLTGSIAGRSAALLQTAWPFMLAGLLCSWYLARDLNLLAMGQNLATGMGQRTLAVKAAAFACVVALAGGAVSIAGPIAFIGIVIPHICRFAVGADHRWLLPYSAAAGALLLVLADIVARFVISPEEIPVGVMTALLGGPFFVHLARKEWNRK